MDEHGVAWQVLLIDTVGDILVDNVAVLTTQSGVVVSSVEESVKYDAMVNYIFNNLYHIQQKSCRSYYESSSN